MLRMGRSFKNDAPKDKNPEVNRQPAPAAPRPAQPAAPPVPRVEAAAPAQHEGAANRALTESETLARDIREGNLNGFVGSTTVLNGDAVFNGMLRIDGRLKGRIKSEKGTLIVSSGGFVEASIVVANAKINGTVHGDIIATERIEFGRTAQVRGNIKTPALVIERGAIFEGSCRMEQGSPAAVSAPRPVEAPRKAPEIIAPVVEKVRQPAAPVAEVTR